MKPQTLILSIMKIPIFKKCLGLPAQRLGRRVLCLVPVLITVGLLNFPGEARGAWIQGVTINSFSSEYVSGADLRKVNDLVKNTGFFGDYLNASPRGSFWLTLPTAPGDFTNAFVTFDLGSVQPVQQMKVWNYNESGVNAGRGVQKADILVAGEDLVFTTILPNQTFNKAPGVFTNTLAQIINMGGVQARYIRINVLTNYGGSSASDFRVGLGKVRFINTNTPPTIKLVTKNFSGNRVTVKFSEPVLPSSATNAVNYSVQSGATTASITSVAMDTFSDRVVLNTSTLDTNLAYTLTATNVLEASGSISITNTTVPVDREFVLWLKADAGVTADGSGLVSQWADQSGAGNDAVQANAAFQPTLVAAALNGKPVLNFVNSAGAINELDSPHTPSLIAEGDISFFAVVTPQSIVLYNSIISKEGLAPNTNFPATFDYELAVTTGKPRLLRGCGGGISTLNGNSNAVAGQTYILELVVKGTNATSYLNGTFNGSALFADGVEDMGKPVRIGRRESNDIWMSGNIAEIMLIRGAVTESERLGIDAYLGRKYGIVTPFTGPPIITSQPPTNVISYVGASATFSVGISTNGASPKTLQWYQTPAVLKTGETNASLVLSNLTLGQDNTSYYLIATNVDGTNQSATATLTVLPVTAPYFIVQPQPQTVYVHQSATFTGQALGSSQLSYQWVLGSTAILGATNPTLIVANVSTNNAGNFTLTVSNSFGTTNSNPAALTVLVPATGSYPAAILEANPLLYYRFSDINDTNVTFNFGSLGATCNGSDQGTYSGVAGPVPPAFPMFESTNLAFGNATLSAGGVAFPAITLNNTVGGPHLTMAAWVYKEFGQTPFCGIIYERGDALPCGIGVNTVGGNDQFIYTWNGGQFSYNSGLLVPNFQWCFLAVVVEPTKATLYLQDGSGMKTATNVVAHAVHPVSLGAGYVGWDTFAAIRRWYGNIDEPMIFDRALTPEQINALYSGTPITPSSSASLNINRSGSNLILSWASGSGTLQRADNVAGPYSDMIGITSPYAFTPGGSGNFYRLRVQ